MWKGRCGAEGSRTLDLLNAMRRPRCTDGARRCATVREIRLSRVCRRLVAHGRGRSVPHNTRTLTSHHSLGAPRWRRNPLGGWQPSTVPRKIEYADAANVDGAPDDGPFATG